MANDSTALSEDNDSQRSNKKYSKSLLLENTLLNETVEKERSKRKVHCTRLCKLCRIHAGDSTVGTSY